MSQNVRAENGPFLFHEHFIAGADVDDHATKIQIDRDGVLHRAAQDRRVDATVSAARALIGVVVFPQRVRWILAMSIEGRRALAAVLAEIVVGSARNGSR